MFGLMACRLALASIAMVTCALPALAPFANSIAAVPAHPAIRPASRMNISLLQLQYESGRAAPEVPRPPKLKNSLRLWLQFGFSGRVPRHRARVAACSGGGPSPSRVAKPAASPYPQRDPRPAARNADRDSFRAYVPL